MFSDRSTLSLAAFVSKNSAEGYAWAALFAFSIGQEWIGLLEEWKAR